MKPGSTGSSAFTSATEDPNKLPPHFDPSAFAFGGQRPPLSSTGSSVPFDSLSSVTQTMLNSPYSYPPQYQGAPFAPVPQGFPPNYPLQAPFASAQMTTGQTSSMPSPMYMHPPNMWPVQPQFVQNRFASPYEYPFPYGMPFNSPMFPPHMLPVPPNSLPPGTPFAPVPSSKHNGLSRSALDPSKRKLLGSTSPPPVDFHKDSNLARRKKRRTHKRMVISADIAKAFAVDPLPPAVDSSSSDAKVAAPPTVSEAAKTEDASSTPATPAPSTTTDPTTVVLASAKPEESNTTPETSTTPATSSPSKQEDTSKPSSTDAAETKEPSAEGASAEATAPVAASVDEAKLNASITWHIKPEGHTSQKYYAPLSSLSDLNRRPVVVPGDKNASFCDIRFELEQPLAHWWKKYGASHEFCFIARFVDLRGQEFIRNGKYYRSICAPSVALMASDELKCCVEFYFRKNAGSGPDKTRLRGFHSLGPEPHSFQVLLVRKATAEDIEVPSTVALSSTFTQPPVNAEKDPIAAKRIVGVIYCSRPFVTRTKVSKPPSVKTSARGIMSPSRSRHHHNLLVADEEDGDSGFDSEGDSGNDDGSDE